MHCAYIMEYSYTDKMKQLFCSKCIIKILCFIFHCIKFIEENQTENKNKTHTSRFLFLDATYFLITTIKYQSSDTLKHTT